MSKLKDEVIKYALLNYKITMLKLRSSENNRHKENSILDIINTIDKILNERYRK